MPRVDRTQYEVLIDEEIPYNNEELERMPVHGLQLDPTHNLDTFFTQIYDYHQNGGFYVRLLTFLDKNFICIYTFLYLSSSYLLENLEFTDYI